MGEGCPEGGPCGILDWPCLKVLGPQPASLGPPCQGRVRHRPSSAPATPRPPRGCSLTPMGLRPPKLYTCAESAQRIAQGRRLGGPAGRCQQHPTVPPHLGHNRAQSWGHRGPTNLMAREPLPSWGPRTRSSELLGAARIRVSVQETQTRTKALPLDWLWDCAALTLLESPSTPSCRPCRWLFLPLIGLFSLSMEQLGKAQPELVPSQPAPFLPPTEMPNEPTDGGSAHRPERPKSRALPSMGSKSPLCPLVPLWSTSAGERWRPLPLANGGCGQVSC